MDIFEDCSFNMIRKEMVSDTVQTSKSHFFVTYWEVCEVFDNHSNSVQTLLKLH